MKTLETVCRLDSTWTEGLNVSVQDAEVIPASGIEKERERE
jgi:hypothetical protein